MRVVCRRQHPLAVVTAATEKKPLNGVVAPMVRERFATLVAYTTLNSPGRWVPIEHLS